AKASDGSVTAIHVVPQPEDHGTLTEHARIKESRTDAVAMLSEAAELGARLGVLVATEVTVAAHPEAEIVEKANSGDFDLLVMGSATRPLSNRAFFGHRVTYLIENAEIPILIVNLPDQEFPGPSAPADD
ncbi:MAG TPA: universal stress protein, partial [Actinobacteria bacterium]|nr:universal stress protein [Actinomycetota bacterium]